MSGIPQVGCACTKVSQTKREEPTSLANRTSSHVEEKGGVTCTPFRLMTNTAGVFACAMGYVSRWATCLPQGAQDLNLEGFHNGLDQCPFGRPRASKHACCGASLSSQTLLRAPGHVEPLHLHIGRIACSMDGRDRNQRHAPWTAGIETNV